MPTFSSEVFAKRPYYLLHFVGSVRSIARRARYRPILATVHQWLAHRPEQVSDRVVPLHNCIIRFIARLKPLQDIDGVEVFFVDAALGRPHVNILRAVRNCPSKGFDHGVHEEEKRTRVHGEIPAGIAWQIRGHCVFQKRHKGTFTMFSPITAGISGRRRLTVILPKTHRRRSVASHGSSEICIQSSSDGAYCLFNILQMPNVRSLFQVKQDVVN